MGLRGDHLVTGDHHVEVVPPQGVQGDLDKRPGAGGDERGGDSRRADRAQQVERPRPPAQTGAEQLQDPGVDPRRADVRIPFRLSQIVVQDTHRLGHGGADDRPAGVGGKITAVLAGQLLQRDVPQLLAVDQGAVHVEEHGGGVMAAQRILQGRGDTGDPASTDRRRWRQRAPG
ncbi:hypothetical protein GCM10009848_39110 [Micromonospora lupini]